MPCTIKKPPHRRGCFVAVGAVTREPLSVWISLLCREFTVNYSYFC